MKNQIYKDEDYTILKKRADVDGTILFCDMFNIINVGLEGLTEWKNCGIQNKKDLIKIFDEMREKMKKLEDEFEEDTNV